MFRLTSVLVLCLAAAALGKVRTSKRPGFMMGNPLYDPVWEDDSKIVGGEEVVPGSRPYQLSFQVDETMMHYRTRSLEKSFSDYHLTKSKSH